MPALADVAVRTLYEAPQIVLHERETSISPIVWWVVAIVVLLLLAATIATAVVIWCIAHGGGYVVTWKQNDPFSVRLACSK